jgi:hypothetical protein
MRDTKATSPFMEKSLLGAVTMWIPIPFRIQGYMTLNNEPQRAPQSGAGAILDHVMLVNQCFWYSPSGRKNVSADAEHQNKKCVFCWGGGTLVAGGDVCVIGYSISENFVVLPGPGW